MKAFLACVDRIECMVLKMLMILIGIVFNLKFKKFLNKLKEIPSYFKSIRTQSTP